jgi:hypothetical protein
MSGFLPLPANGHPFDQFRAPRSERLGGQAAMIRRGQ